MKMPTFNIIKMFAASVLWGLEGEEHNLEYSRRPIKS